MPENKNTYKPLSWQLAFSICRPNMKFIILKRNLKAFATTFVLRHYGDMQRDYCTVLCSEGEKAMETVITKVN